MSTSSGISGGNPGDTDGSTGARALKTARAAATQRGAKSLDTRSSRTASLESADDHQPRLKESEQSRNRDCGQTSPECRAQVTLHNRTPEKFAIVEVMAPCKTIRQSMPRSNSRHLTSQPAFELPSRTSHTLLSQEQTSPNKTPTKTSESQATYSRVFKGGKHVAATLLNEVEGAPHASEIQDQPSLEQTKMNTGESHRKRATLSGATSASEYCLDATQNPDVEPHGPGKTTNGPGRNPCLLHCHSKHLTGSLAKHYLLRPLQDIQQAHRTVQGEHQEMLPPESTSTGLSRSRSTLESAKRHPLPVRTPTRISELHLDSDLRFPLPESLSLSLSPISPCVTSEGETSPEEYDTPLTSPSLSPAKSHTPTRGPSFLDLSFAQLDGERGSIGDSLDDIAGPKSSHEGSETAVEEGHEQVRRLIDLTEVDATAQPLVELDLTPEDATPLTRASKAKDAPAFPFPPQSSSRHHSSMLSAQRHPSRLLRFCERNATPRQQRLLAGTLESPDRFIPGRTATPDKDALLLRRPLKKRIDPRQRPFAVSSLSDPFGPSAIRNARTADRYATIRTPSATHRPVSLSGTAVSDVMSANSRAISSGAVWTVGGTTVTEGIASITNGRGGRVTSGTSAPHYTADFLRRQSPSEDEVQHGQRLAVAMEVQPSARMINHGSPYSTPSSSSPRRSSCSNIGRKRTVWNNNAWEKSSPSTPSKSPKRKTKDIPVIPFRVLDAPALRDDYYCSLLAYSPTSQCLAVGLGPHVYLWSEVRGTTPTHIPDSLTAPFGLHVTSVSFSSVQGGKSILAIGRADGRITLWSPQDRDPRFDSEQPAPVSCVSFRPTAVNRPSIREPSMIVATEELLVGDEAGSVYYYSVEWPSPDECDLFGWHGSMTLLARMSCHTQQICGIAWSKDGDLFATGSNDNQLLLFETKKLFAKGRNGSAGSQASTVTVRNGNSTESDDVAGQGGVLAIPPGQQKHMFTLNAAVKAIAFAPWQSSLLAAGGGSNDRCIHFFHALSGATLATIDCHAQVTSLVWSEKRKEIAATFGFAQPDHPFRVAVFSWPSCQRIVGIPWWSEERALYAVAYPGAPSAGLQGRGRQFDAEGRPWHGRRTRDEGCLVIATSDASIKFHEIWPEKSEKVARERGGAGSGVLGGSVILEDAVSFEMERESAIR